ncbi:MAG: EAL domain-containing protein [Bauldia sp.]|nr:EAL domain-containing protein [Bauldia sp.]
MPRPSFSLLGVRTKFVLLLLTFGLFPAAVLYALVITNDQGVKDLSLARVRAAAEEIGQSVSTSLRERYDSVQAFAINGIARDPEQWYSPAGRRGLVAAIDGYVDLYGVYRVSAIVDTFGRVVAANTIPGGEGNVEAAVAAGLDFGTEGWFRAVVEGSALSEVPGRVYVGAPVAIAEVAALTGGDGLVIPFAAPITDAVGDTIGYWVNFADFALVTDIVADAIATLDAEGYAPVRVTMTTTDGAVLLDGAGGGSGALDAGAAITGLAAIGGIAGTTQPLGWTVAVTIPAAQAFGAWQGILRALLYGVLILAAIVLALGWGFGAVWTRPIRKLKELMKRLETEPADTPIPYLDRRDELGSMARSLVVLRDGMRRAGEVEAQRNAKEYLAALVAERTSDLASANAILAERGAWLEGILGNLPVAVGLIEAKTHGVLVANRQMTDVLGAAAVADGGRSLFGRFRPHRPDGSAVAADDLPTERALRGEVVNCQELELRRDDEMSRFVAVNASPIRNKAGEISAAVVVVEDITARRAVSERIRHLAMIDPLTGLPNRRAFFAEVDAALLTAREGGTSIALLLVDLDDFRSVNDIRGHHVGDQALAEVAQRIRGSLRASDIVARIAGDEFAVVACDVTDTASLSSRCDRILGCFDLQFNEKGGSFALRGSIGVALSEYGAVSAEELFQRSDLALQSAKNSGGGTYRFFTTEMRLRAIELAVADAELPRALREGTLEVYYQPILDITDLSVVSVEALLRWRHPARGLLAPGAFLHHAERNRQIVPITAFVMDVALGQLADWRRRGLSGFRLALNLSSAAVIDDTLPDHLARRIVTEGLRSNDLILEVTEGAMNEFERSVAALRRYREMGLTIAIDDFGAGYSSLARLRDLPIDLIKFDRAFIDSDPRASAILSAMIHLANSLGIPAVAEGVELEEQVEMLRNAKVPLAQGFYFARPMPAAEFETWLSRHQGGRGALPAVVRNRPKLAS